MLSAYIGRALTRFRDFLARILIRADVSPNFLTICGMLCNLAAAPFLALGYLYTGFALIIASCFLDSLDGAVAKVGGKVSPLGAFLDSTLDRYSDAAILAGLIIYFLRSGNLLVGLFGFSALVGSFAVSYVRARAENFIPSCKVGYWQRGERVTYILVGLLWGRVDVVLLLLGVLTHWTVLQRILHTRHFLLKGEPYRPKSLSMRCLYWDFPRGTIWYDIFTAGYVLIPIIAAIIRWRGGH